MISEIGQLSRLPGNPASYIVLSMAGESPPPPPRACFGRGELIEKIVGLAENFTPIALIGAGGIGKTSTALTVLHDDRIKQRFGDNRRFIRCDKFPASLPHFLHRLSMAIGAGVENPEDLAPLRPFLSSRKIFIVLDNVESILDPRGMDAQEIYDMVEELSQFNNVCLCLTSRISIVPPACKSLDVPTLSMEAAHDAFYYIYEHGERSDQVSNVLKQLDFHPLSVTLLATVALHNKWSADRLTKEWGKRRTGVLHTQHDKSLAATVELSLASPMFQELGPDARELLGVVAFFPQGVDENNLGWLFPAMPDITNVFDTFCNLSLTYKSGGFVTMLAPLRDYLSPKVPESSQLLWATKWHYFGRLTVNVGPENPGFEEARWIMSEDVNIEHLLDVFTSIDADSNAVWNACSYFMQHLYWHKPRLVVLGLKIEELPDSHPSKPRCLHRLSQLFASVGNRAEEKRLLGHALRICGELGNDLQVAQTLLLFCRVNQKLGLNEEGLSQAKEALEIYERFHNVFGQVQSLLWFAWMLCDDNQVDAAEEAGSRALDLSSGEGNQFQVSNCHRLLGHIYSLKKEIETAIYHFKGALEIASHFNWRNEQLLCHSSLADLFADEGRFSDAHIHIEHSRSHAVDDPYNLGCVLKQHAHILRAQGRLEEAKFEAFHATAVFEKLGAAHDLERSRWLLQGIQEEMNNSAAIHKQDDGGGLLKRCCFVRLLILRSLRSGPRVITLVLASPYHSSP